MHNVTALKIPGESLSQLRCLDYNDSRLFELTYASIEVSGEPQNHKWQLRDSILEQGITNNVIIFERKQSTPILVEGHHRCVIAYENKFQVPVTWHYCSCPLNSLDFFGLCPIVLQACKNQITDNSVLEYF